MRRSDAPAKHPAVLFETGGFRTVIEHTVTCVFGVKQKDLHLPRRGRAGIALARQTAMYLAHTSFSLTYAEVGTLFERDRTTVAHACRAIEDRREDPTFDRALELLDRAIRALLYPRFFELLKRLPVSKTMTRKALRTPHAKPPSISSPLSLLVKLAKRDCIGEIVITSNGTRALKLITGTGLAERSGAQAPYAVFAESRDQGWIAPRDESGLRWAVSQSGRLLLRRIQSQGEGIVRAQTALPAPAVAQASINPAESPLAWLRRRKDRSGQPLISALEFDAGERLRADLWFGQMSPRVTVNWSANGGGAQGGRRSWYRSARQRCGGPAAGQARFGGGRPDVGRPVDRCLRASPWYGANRASPLLASSLGQGRSPDGALGVGAPLWAARGRSRISA